MMDAVITFGNLQMNPPRGISIAGFEIYFYGIIIAAGYILAGLYTLKQRDSYKLSADNVIDIFLCAMIGGLVGARLYYVLFNFNDYFGPGKWMNILRVRDGGLAVYGGIILGCLLAVLYGRKKKLNLALLLDAAGGAIPIGQAIGRWGNFINREAYGYETMLPWKMGLTDASGVTIYVHPTFLYESLWNVAGFLLLHFFSKKWKRFNGQIFLMYVLWYGLGRVWIEGLRTDSLYLGGSGIRVSQALAAACIAVSLVLLIVLGIRSKNKPLEQDAPEGVEDTAEPEMQDTTDDAAETTEEAVEEPEDLADISGDETPEDTEDAPEPEEPESSEEQVEPE